MHNRPASKSISNLNGFSSLGKERLRCWDLMHVYSVSRSDLDAEGKVRDTHTLNILYLVAQLYGLSKPSDAKQISIIGIYQVCMCRELLGP
jgi:hypothetical protein